MLSKRRAEFASPKFFSSLNFSVIRTIKRTSAINTNFKNQIVRSTQRSGFTSRTLIVIEKLKEEKIWRRIFFSSYLTTLLTGAAPLDERSNATTAYGAVSGAAAS